MRILRVFAAGYDLAGLILCRMNHARDQSVSGDCHYNVLQRSPSPHFHASYGDYEIEVSITDGVVTGRFPGRALRLVLEWYRLHESELIENWELAENRRPLNKIDPLE